MTLHQSSAAWRIDHSAAATLQTCVIHLIRNTFRYTARQDWDKGRPATYVRSTPP